MQFGEQIGAQKLLVPLPEVPLPEVPLPEVPLPEVPLPEVPFPGAVPLLILYPL